MTAAEAAAQAAVLIWKQMTTDEQQDWLASRERNWPPVALFLPPLLVAVERIIADMNAERDREMAAAARRQREG